MRTEAFRYQVFPQLWRLPPDWSEVFGRKGPIWVEVGFGNGEFLAAMASKHPEVNFVGFELSLTSFVKAQKRFFNEGLENIRLVMVDGRFGLRELFKDGEVERVYVNFPCPWSKKGYEDRRITTDDFVKTLGAVLEDGGIFELMTDDERYSKEVYEKLTESGLFKVHEVEVNKDRGLRTRYERKWIEMGRKTFLIKAEKVRKASVERLTWGEEEVHVRIEKVDEGKIRELAGKVFKGRNDRVFVVKDVFISPDGDGASFRIISSDKGFQQHYYAILEKRKDFWLLKLDSTCHPYRTPAVKWSIYKIAEEIRK